MESIRFDNLIKDIFLLFEIEYKRKFIEKIKYFCKRMRWKAFFFFNINAEGSRKEIFGFFFRKLFL